MIPKRRNLPKSKKYEVLVKDLLAAKLEKELPNTDFQVFFDKKYVGKSGHEHQIDVSAELKIAGVRIIILVECKLYSRKIGIDDVMEFATRIDDIAAHKGIIATTVGFQEGAVKLAQSKGIALVVACDLGIIPHFESPIGEISRHKAFVEISRGFLRWFLPSDLSSAQFEAALRRIAALDVMSPLGPTPTDFCSLTDEGPGPRYARIFASYHAYIDTGEETNVILDTRGLFKLMCLDLWARTQETA